MRATPLTPRKASASSGVERIRERHQQLVLLAALRRELLGRKAAAVRASAGADGATGSAVELESHGRAGGGGKVRRVGTEAVAQVDHRACAVRARASGPAVIRGTGCANARRASAIGLLAAAPRLERGARGRRAPR